MNNIIKFHGNMCPRQLLGMPIPDSFRPDAVLEESLPRHINLTVFQLPTLVDLIEAAARHTFVDTIGVFQVVQV